MEELKSKAHKKRDAEAQAKKDTSKKKNTTTAAKTETKDTSPETPAPEK